MRTLRSPWRHPVLRRRDGRHAPDRRALIAGSGGLHEQQVLAASVYQAPGALLFKFKERIGLRPGEGT